jgi:triosephosphate isomerase
MLRKSLVVANWKMNGSLASNQTWYTRFLLQKLPDIDIVVIPSHIYLPQAAEYLKNTTIGFGAQDIANASHGAYTGQVSANMIKDFGSQYVIIGHSERRSLCQETDDLVAEKTKLALTAQLHAIVCVGETLEQRKANKTKDIIAKQLNTVLELCKNDDLAKLIVAYEPVWAIGTGLVATPEQAEEMHLFIRELIKQCVSSDVANNTRLLYGGSVNASNSANLFNKPNIDGGLIGGASLDADSFLQICMTAKR